MSNFPYQFPEDLTGGSPRNLVQNETHTFSNRDDRIFVPSGGPFFTESLRIVDKDTGEELEPVTQFKAVHLQNAATLDSGQQVCCVIIVSDKTIAGVKIKYQAVGGKYGEVVTTLREIINEIDWDKLKQISWGSDVYGKPDLFPAAPHRHAADDFTGWSRTLQALYGIHQALIAKDTASWESVYGFINRLVNSVKDDTYRKDELDQKIVALRFDEDDLNLVSDYKGNLISKRSDGVYYNGNFRLANKVGNYTLKGSDIGNNTLIRLVSGGTRTLTIPVIKPEPEIGSSVVITSANGLVRLKSNSGVTTNPSIGSSGLTLNKVADYVTCVYTGNQNWNFLIATDVDMKVIDQIQETDRGQTSEINRLKTLFNQLKTIDIAGIRTDVNYIKTVDFPKFTTQLAALKKKVDSLVGGGSGEIPVGGLFITSVQYANSAAVKQTLGYGEWEPYAQGEALVGVGSSANPEWTRQVGNIYGESEHKLVTEELPEDGFKMRKAGHHGSRRHGGRGTTYAGGDRNSMTTISSDESGWKGVPFNIVQPSIVVGAWVRVDGGYKPRKKKSTNGSGIVVSELSLTMSHVTTRINGGSIFDNSFKRYLTVKSVKNKAIGFKFPKVPVGEVSNFVYDYSDWQKGIFPAGHWFGQVDNIRLEEPYYVFELPLPVEYDSNKHEVKFTSSVAEYVVQGNKITVKLKGTYRVLKNSSVTSRFWDVNPQTIAIQLVNR